MCTTCSAVAGGRPAAQQLHIVDAVAKAGGPALDKRSVRVDTPIKTVGSHTVIVALHPEVDVDLEVDVVGSA